MKIYRKDIDILKFFSIIGVILYHIGILKSGYLGVDIFFIINGFLIIPSIYKKICSNEFKYIDFIKNKYLRLAPLVIVISIISLIIGAIYMIPDDFENLSQSVIASLLFSQNILSEITTKDYWNIINEYKPLMHLWYVGILMEFYLIVPLILNIIHKFSNKLKCKSDIIVKKTINILFCISFILFLVPTFKTGVKFYFIIFRLWEILLGGIIGININNINSKIKSNKNLKLIGMIGIIFVLIIGVLNTNYLTLWQDKIIPIGSKDVYSSNLIIPNFIMIIFTALFTAIYLISEVQIINSKYLEFFGKASYSLYIWHQPLLAFYRYFVKYELSIFNILIYLIIVFCVSFISYYLFEKRKQNNKNLIICIVLTIIIEIISFNIYLNAGVITDVPELDIKKSNISKNFHSKYVDRIYKFDKDFKTNKIKILVIGNSFARDFANILLESDMHDKIELSYIYNLDDDIYTNRIKESNYIFYAGYKSDLNKEFWKYVNNKDNVYGIGTKNFGENNGNIYINRHKKDYFDQTVNLNYKYKKLNEELKNEWGKNYIDLLELVTLDKNKIKIFTDDNKYISQDCHHLTQNGAQYYSKLIDISSIIK